MKGLPGGTDTEADEAAGGLGGRGKERSPVGAWFQAMCQPQLQGTLEYEWQLTYPAGLGC